MHDVPMTLSEVALCELVTGGLRAYANSLPDSHCQEAGQLKALIYILTHLQEIGGFDRYGKLDLTGIQKFYLGVLKWRPADLSSAYLHELSAAFSAYTAQKHNQPLTKSILEGLLAQFPDKTRVSP